MKKLHFIKGKLSVIGIVVMCFLALLALLTFLGGSWFGFVFLFPGAVIFSIKEGVYIDLEKKMYKSYLSILWISSARWKPIPDGTRIGIRKLKLVARRAVGPMVMDSTGETTTMELFLYMPKPERVVLTTSDDIKFLYERAQFIHQHLGYEIVVDERISEDKYLR